MITLYTECPLCLEPSSAHDTSRWLCRSCINEWPVVSTCCQQCAEPLGSESDFSSTTLLCGHCQQHPPWFDQVYSAGLFAQSPAWIIKQFKYQRRFYWSNILAQQLVRQLERHYNKPWPDALIPMPLHWSRLFSRGFNQAQLLANEVGKLLSIQVLPKAVKRIKRTPALEGLNRKQRQRLLNQAFRVHNALPERVAIIDDVMTTGSSANGLARVLKKAGVSEVDVWVTARTPRF